MRKACHSADCFKEKMLYSDQKTHVLRTIFQKCAIGYNCENPKCDYKDEAKLRLADLF